MNINEMLDLIESGIPFTELYKYLCNTYPQLDSTWLWNMADVAYQEYKEEQQW